VLHAGVPNWRVSLVVLWSANFLAALGMMILLPYFPLFLRELGVREGRSLTVWAGVIVGAAPFSAAIMGGIWGAVGDRIGRRAMVLRALLGVAVFVGLMGFARSPVELLLLRFCQGMFSGFFAPTLTLLSVMAPLEYQARTSGWLQSAFLAGGVVGPGIGGLLATTLGFSALVWTCAALALLAALAVRCLVPEPPREAPAEQRTEGERIFHLALRVLRGIFFDLRQILSNRMLQALFLAMFLVRVASAAPNPTLILFVERLLGEVSAHSSHVASAVFTAYPVAVLLAIPFWSTISDRSSPARVLLLCIGGAFLCMLGQCFIRTPFQLGLLRFGTGAFVSGVLPAGFVMVARASDRAKRGGATGLAFSALAFGLCAGPWLASLVDGLFGYRALLALCTLLLLLALIRVRFPRLQT